MTLQSSYIYVCDGVTCGKKSMPQENNYYTPEGWSAMQVKRQNGSDVIHLCPACTEAVLDVVNSPTQLIAEETFN